jgi:Domain of unknown function (DUF4252)
MKKIVVIGVVISLSHLSFAQSESYEQLREQFIDRENVHSFSVSGFWCRMLMGWVIEEDELFRQALQEVKQVRALVVPQQEWRQDFQSSAEFLRTLKGDGFEELATIRDRGEKLSFYIRPDGKRRNQYFILIEEANEVVAIELRGYLDPELLKGVTLTSQNR